MTSFSADAWANTTESTGSQENPPPPAPGMYEVCLDDGRAFTSKAGKDFVVFTWRVVSGPNAGYKWDDLRGFSSPKALAALKATCARLGIDTDVPSLEELDVRIRGQVGEWFAVDVVQNGDYVNVYVKDAVQPRASDVPADAADFATAGTAKPADDVPW